MNYSKELVHQFFQVSRAMTKHLNQRLNEFTVTHAQLAILDYLAETNEARSLVDIANYLNVEKSTISRSVKHLEKNGFIEHVTSADSRERRITFSAAFQSVQPMVKQTKESFETSVFHNISEEELLITYQTLLKIWNNLNGAEHPHHD